MESSVRRSLAIAALLVVLANTADLVSTYLASPNLSNEWNVLQRQFSLGWPGLIAAKLVGMTLAICGYACYLRFREACYPPPGATYASFSRYLSFGRQADRPDIPQVLGGIPIGPHLAVNLGYFWAGMQGLMVWVAADNLLLRMGYMFALRRYSEMCYHLLQSTVVAAIVLRRFYRGNFARYTAMTGEAVAVRRPAVAGEVQTAAGG